ncbi:phosphohexomutase domain-containing protein, partial [Candidatus Bandiella numerosa]
AYEDNGLKLFGPDGYKLSDEIELEIESRMDRALDDKLAAPSALGRTRRVDDAQARYVEIVKATFPRGMRLSGLRVCIDCANGAAYKVAPAALYELGAEIFPIGVSPDGFNINQEVGSTNTLALREAVRKYRADIGIALDGDADRCILVDETGEEIDGDQLIGLIATDWKKRDLLARDGVVTTAMSNLG